MNAIILVGLACVVAADPAGASLRGTVVDADGRPVAGARVDLPTAAPRIGPGLFCPSCYPDCAKSAPTDEQGRFEFHGLNPNLKFRVLVMAPGKKAALTNLTDPQAGEVRVALQRLPPEADRDRIVLAKLVDDDGAPVAGALVDPYGAKTADRRWWGQVDGVDPAVSDAEGNVSILVPAGFLGLDVKVMIHNSAGATVQLLTPGPDRHKIVLPAGTKVTGRLVHDGRSAAGLTVAVVQLERTAGHHFIKAVSDVTNADGRFVFDNLPAAEDYAIFSPVGEGPQKLVLTTKRFRAAGNRQSRDLGDLPVRPPLRLAGRLELPAGRAVPPNTKITLGRDPAWDLIAVPVAADGGFVAEGLPPETYEVRVAIKGLAVDGTRLPFQVLGEQSFGLRLREGVSDLTIPLTAAPSGGAKR